MKKCTKCFIEKNNNEFDFERNQCKQCRNKMRLNHVKKVYEINVLEKECYTCKLIKPADKFYIHRRRSTGLHDDCKECLSTARKQKYLLNPEKQKKRSAERYAKVRGTEVINKPSRERQKRKMQTDPRYVITRRLRNRLYYALKKKSWKKDTKFYDYIGCDLETLKAHLEVQFTEGMSWSNQGEWHIDHVKPLDSATTVEELYSLCHYTNLQPMWAKDNLSKGAKI